MSPANVVEHATLSDELLQELAAWFAQSFAHGPARLGKLLVPYEQDKELWVASMASIIAAARLGGRIFTADENNSLMLLYMPGKSASGIEASKHTPEHKRFVELAQNKYPQHAQWVTQDSDTVLAATTNKSWPGSSPADSIHVQFLGTKVGHQGKGSRRALLRAAQTIADEEKVPCAIEASLPVVRSARVAVVEGLLADDRRHHFFRMLASMNAVVSSC